MSSEKFRNKSSYRSNENHRYSFPRLKRDTEQFSSYSLPDNLNYPKRRVIYNSRSNQRDLNYRKHRLRSPIRRYNTFNKPFLISKNFLNHRHLNNREKRHSLNRKELKRDSNAHQPYAVSPVRCEIDSKEEEMLDRFEILSRLKEAKNTDNFDDLYHYRELLKELKASGAKFVSTKLKKNNCSDEFTMNDIDLDDIECIDALEEEEEEDTQENGGTEDERNDLPCTSISVESNNLKTDEQSIVNEEKLRNKKRIKRREKNDENDDQMILSMKSNHDELVNKRSDDCNLNISNKNDAIENCDSSFDYEEEADFLQFDEDSLDIDEIVKAAEIELREAEQCCSNNIYENNNEIADQLELLTDDISEEF